MVCFAIMDYKTDIEQHSFERLRTEVTARVPDNSTVLEIRSATGGLTKQLKEKGCNVTAVALEVADIDELDFKQTLTEKYDVIIFDDVVARLKRPETVLNYVGGLLSNNGIILASIPNIGFGYYRLEHLKGNFRYESSGILDKAHLKFYDRNGLYSLFESAGYYIKGIERMRKSVPRGHVSDALSQIGVKGSAVAAKQLERSLDFDVCQYFVTACRIGGGDEFKVLHEKAIDHITQLKIASDESAGLREVIAGRDRDVEALKGNVKLLEDMKKAVEKQREHISNLENSLASKNEYIDDILGQLKKIHKAVVEL